jgi:hypothetical protein
MAVSSTHRWIALGTLILRQDKRAGANAPNFGIDEVLDIAKQQLAADQQYREFGGESRLMWFSNFGDHNQYHVFLAEVGDKNTSGVSFIDFPTRTTRDVPKRETEGGHFNGHIAIAKAPGESGGHLILVERVPGIYLGSVKAHFAWLSQDDRLRKSYNDDAGKDRSAKPVFEILGHQSVTIRDALRSGILQDIEFVRYDETHEDGLDEDPVIREVVHQTKWGVKRRVSESEASSLFDQMKAYFRDKFRGDDSEASMFVRIKANTGQIKRTEVLDSKESVLEQAFVHNELVSDFATPLAQRHEMLREDVVSKMLAIPEELIAPPDGDTGVNE